MTPEGKVEEFILGNDVLKGHVPRLTVPGGCLKAAKILLDESRQYEKFPDEIPFSLISEKMSPGFDYKDREVLAASEVKSLPEVLRPIFEEYCAPDNEN